METNENANCLSWLHLSDLHWGKKDLKNSWPTCEERLFDDLVKLKELGAGPWDVVFFTGDLVCSGKRDEYQGLDEQLDRLWEKLEELGSKPVLLPVPGNHDLQRPRAGDDRVKTMARDWDKDDDLRQEFWEVEDSVYRKVVKVAFQGYENWFEKQIGRLIPSDIRRGLLPGDFAATVPARGSKIGVVGLNTTFLQLTDEDYSGRLALSAGQLRRLFERNYGQNYADWFKDHDVCVLLTHQPPTWLSKRSMDEYRNEVARHPRFAVHLCGHRHGSDEWSYREGGADTEWVVQACSLFSEEKYGDRRSGKKQKSRQHGYAAGILDLSEEQAWARIWPRQATREKGSGVWVIKRAEDLHVEEKSGALPWVKVSRLRPRPPAPPPLPLMGEPNLPDVIKDGGFTAFVGVGHYEICGNRKEAQQKLADKMKALQEDLSGKERPDHWRYLRAVVDAHFSGIPDEDITTADPATLPDWLRQFQCALIAAGVTCHRLFGKALQGDPALGVGPEAFRVSVWEPASLDEVREFLGALSEAQNALTSELELDEDCSPDDYRRPCFGRQAASQKLESFASRLREPGARLLLRDVEWLADLLWHSLRYDLPVLPAPADLAFHFSLCAQETPTGTYRPGVAAMAFRKSIAARRSCRAEHSMMLTLERFQRLTPRKAPSDPLTEGVADALCSMYRRFLEKSTATPASFSSRRRPYPLAILNTLDDGLLRCLARRHQDYLLVLPTYAKRQPEGGESAVWFLGIFRHTDDGEAMPQEWREMTGLSLTTLVKDRLLVGPLVVMARGGSFTLEPRDKERAPSADPALLLSIEDLLGWHFSRDLWPKLVRDEMEKPGRASYFVGYPLNDPDELVLMHQHSRLADDVQSRQDGRQVQAHVVVDCSDDPVWRTALKRGSRWTCMRMYDPPETIEEFGARLASAVKQA